MPEVKKVVKPRKKKVAVELEEVNTDFNSVNLGVLNETTQYNFSVKSPVFVTGYAVNDLDNIRRTLVAHYSKQSDIVVWAADYNKDMVDVGVKKIFTEKKSQKSEIRSLLENILAVYSKFSHKVLFVTNAFQLVSDDEEIADLLLKLVDVAKLDPAFHLYLFTHAHRVNVGNAEVQRKFLDSAAAKIVAGNMMNHEMTVLFGDADRGSAAVHLGKSQDVVYVGFEKPTVFVPRKTVTAWFK